MRSVTFLKRFANFNAGESASLGDERADAVVAAGVATFDELIDDSGQSEPTSGSLPADADAEDQTGNRRRGKGSSAGKSQ